MAKKKILFFIPVEDETYVKWQITKNKIAGALIPFSIGATIGAAWLGYAESIKNAGDIAKLKKATSQIEAKAKYCINDHAEHIDKLHDHVMELERQNNLLLEKAFRDTLGEEEKSA